MKAIDIALCGDRRILPGIAVAVRSALEASSCKLNIHIVGDGLTRQDEINLIASWRHPNCGEINFFSLSKSAIANFRATLYLKSKAAYARYFIPDAFSNLSRCAYLDGDVMVCRDLAELHEFDIGGNIAATVVDIGSRVNPINPELRQRLALRDERNYFNSGFMYLDCEKWRSERLTEKLVRLSYDKADILHAQDQDALNVALEGRVMLLDTSWNTSQYERPTPLAGHIVHMIGPIKPWHRRYSQKYEADLYYRDVIMSTFRDYLSRTKFATWRASRFGNFGEWLYEKTPTLDMIAGKIRRSVFSPN